VYWKKEYISTQKYKDRRANKQTKDA